MVREDVHVKMMQRIAVNLVVELQSVGGSGNRSRNAPKIVDEDRGFNVG